MNERHLFRGKRLNSGRWAQGSLVCGNNKFHIVDMGILEQVTVGSLHEVDPATVGQCTGIRDWKGMLIYEGDIYKDSLKIVSIVEWDKINARFLGFTLENERRISYVGKEPAVEIIGNIHDNPDLINKGAPS